jgi:serine/threonine protein kinase
VQTARRRADDANLAVKIVSLEGRTSKGSNGGTRKSKGQGEADEGPRPASVLSACMHMDEIVSELASWSAVQGSEHVVSLVSAMVEGPRVFMVMERCEIDITSKVAESPCFWALESQRVLKEMLLGVQACHFADIVHRDIKPQNFLLGSDGVTVKLCDFGLATRMPRRGQLWGMVGTVPFASPEMLKDDGYDKATDMWSYGVTAYLLCFGVYPFPFRGLSTHSDMKNVILLGLAPRCLQKGGGRAAFITPQLERCKSARCTVEEALAHWYLQEDPSANAESPKLDMRRASSSASTADIGTRSSSLESTSSGSITPRLLDDGSLRI